MKIIVESHELKQFLNQVIQYHADMTMRILTHMSATNQLGQFSEDVNTKMKAFIETYKKQHPPPSWKDLLPD